MKVRREVLGDSPRRPRGRPPATAFTRRSRTSSPAPPGASLDAAGLDRRTRSCITLAMLTALGAEDELGMHVRGGATATAYTRGDPRGAPPHGRLRRRARRQLGLRGCAAGARAIDEDDDRRLRRPRTPRASRRLRPVARTRPGGHPRVRRRATAQLTLHRGRPRDRAHPRRGAALPAHARRSSATCAGRPALLAQPAGARARLRLPVRASRCPRSPSRTSSGSSPRSTSRRRSRCSTTTTSSTSPACRRRGS